MNILKSGDKVSTRKTVHQFPKFEETIVLSYSNMYTASVSGVFVNEGPERSEGGAVAN